MNTPQEYAQTLFDAEQSKTQADFDKFYSNFLGLLKMRSHEKMVPEIISAVEGLSEQNQASTQVLVAKESDFEKFKSEIESHDDVQEGKYEVVTDENVIGGYVVRTGTSQVDNSYRTRLLELYKAMT